MSDDQRVPAFDAEGEPIQYLLSYDQVALRRVQEIETRVEACAPAPWFAVGAHVCMGAPRARPMARNVVAHCEMPPDQEADAKVIAHSREDLPWLCEQVRTLQESVKTMTLARDLSTEAYDETRVALADALRRLDSEFKRNDVLRDQYAHVALQLAEARKKQDILLDALTLIANIKEEAVSSVPLIVRAQRIARDALEIA